MDGKRLGYLSGSAFGTAAMTLVGQNLGAGRPDQAAKSGWTAFGLGCAVMSAMGLIFYTFCPWMARLFCEEGASPGGDCRGCRGCAAVDRVRHAGIGLVDHFDFGVTRAGDTVVPVVISWIGFLGVRIPLAYALALPGVDLGPLGYWQCAGLGLHGAWMAMFADIVVRGLIFLWRFAGGRWKRMRV